MHRARVGDFLAKKSLPWHSINNGGKAGGKHATEEPLLAGMMANPYSEDSAPPEAVALRQSMSLSPQAASAASLIHNKNKQVTTPQKSLPPTQLHLDDDDI
eukprot:GFYU01015929.1.p1 GENE.GFYU01015929.1~~GFYU01015929.1.p1  ORF type:complete len:101 (-),score=13.17 GFYU01015929.1:369-671(-)